jgi:structural maintenance of chromosome 4
MKPKATTEHEDGLLEYLEDIIGTSRYKEPIEEALQEMDRLSEDRVEKLNRLRITEREKNTLEEQKREAENYLRLQNELVRSKSRLWQWYIWKCFQTNGEFEKKIVSSSPVIFRQVLMRGSRILSVESFKMNAIATRTTLST